MIHSPIGVGIDKVKKMIEGEYSGIDEEHPIPILHNEDRIILQYNGWSLTLLGNGQWGWEITEGG